jgi:hypothetical protein
VADQSLDSLVQGRGLGENRYAPHQLLENVHLRSPSQVATRGVAQLVHGPDDLQERLQRTLPNPVVIVCKLADQLDSAILDVRQEVGTSGSEESTDGVCGNLLLDTDHAVDLEHLVDINLFKGVDPDSSRRGTSRGKGFCGTVLHMSSVPTHQSAVNNLPTVSS